MAGISIWQLAIIGLIVVLLFGTRKLRGLGGDLGSAIKGFKQALADDGGAAASPDPAQRDQAADTEQPAHHLGERR